MKTIHKISMILCLFSYWILGCEGKLKEEFKFVNNEKIDPSGIYESSVKNIFLKNKSETNRWDWVHTRGEEGISSHSGDLKVNKMDKNIKMVKKLNIGGVPDKSSYIHVAKNGSGLKLIAGNSRII